MNPIDLRDVENIKIPLRDYMILMNAQTILDDLLAGGVDNWEGYDVCMEYVELPFNRLPK